MKKILTILSIFICFISQAQTLPPTTGTGSVPSSKTDWYQGKYLQGMIIVELRDTLFTPRYAGTMVFWQHAGVDSSFWGWDGFKWNKTGSGGSSVVPSWQEVTDVGATTTNDFSLINGSAQQLLLFQNSANEGNIEVYSGDDGSVITALRPGYLRIIADSGRIEFAQPGDFTTYLKYIPNSHANNVYLPDSSGIVALSVNGNFANDKGEISLDVACQQNWDDVLTAQGTDQMTTHTIDWGGNDFIQENAGVISIASGTSGSGIFSITEVNGTSAAIAASDGVEQSLLVASRNGNIAFNSSTGIYNYGTAPITYSTGGISILGYNNTTGNVELTDVTAPFSSSDIIYQFQDSTNTPPVSFPVGVDTTYWLVGGAGTGIFATHEYEIALYVNGIFDSFIVPNVNDWGLTLDDNIWHQYDGSTWPRRNSPPWLTNGNFGGGILGSTNNSIVNLRFNNSNRIILQGTGTRFPQLTGAGTGLMGLSTVGLASNVQIGTGLLLSGGTLSSTVAGTVTGVTATLPITSSGGTAPVISTSMATNKLIGRYSAGTGVMQEITISTGLSLDGSGNLTASGTSPTWQQTLTTGSTLTTDNTITATGLAFTWNTARWTLNATDSVLIAATNKVSLNSVADSVNIRAGAATYQKAPKWQGGGTVMASLTAETGAGDSLGYRFQLSGTSTGTFWLGGTALGVGTFADSIVTYNTTTKKQSYASFNQFTYWTRVAAAGVRGRLYPSGNVLDTVQVGSSTANAVGIFNVTGNMFVSSFSSIGGNQPSSASSLDIGVVNSTITTMLNITGGFANTGAAGRGIFLNPSINLAGPSASLEFVGVFAQPQTGNLQYTTAALSVTGVRALPAWGTSNASSVVFPLYVGVEAGLLIRQNNVKNLTAGYGFYASNPTAGTGNSGVATTYTQFLMDSLGALVTNPVGIDQRGTNAQNWFSGKVGIGNPVHGTLGAFLNLAAGTTTIAPLKFTSGTDLTTGVDGSVNYNGTDLRLSVSTTWYTINKSLSGSGTLDFPSTLAGQSSDLTITVTGAADGDPVILGTPNGSTVANSVFTCWVSAANTVTVRFQNGGAIAQDPASGSFKVRVIK